MLLFKLTMLILTIMLNSSFSYTGLLNYISKSFKCGSLRISQHIAMIFINYAWWLWFLDNKSNTYSGDLLIKKAITSLNLPIVVRTSISYNIIWGESLCCDYLNSDSKIDARPFLNFLDFYLFNLSSTILVIGELLINENSSWERIISGSRPSS